MTAAASQRGRNADQGTTARATAEAADTRWEDTSPTSSRHAKTSGDGTRGAALVGEGRGRFDLLAVPGVGALVRRKGFRTVVRLVILALAAGMVIHGLFGSQLAPKNLATLWTWVHYRGLLVLGLLVAGNLFCYACPIVLVRDGLRRIFHPALSWPRVLRGKWVAASLFALVLYSYELLDLWGDPWGTAWLVIAYFAIAAIVDVLFRGATFCKSICPVGQFNFLAATVSPLEVSVREPARCDECSGKECIRGTEPSPEKPVQRGCELALFQPHKVGNFDCTFCLDCVYACPEDNIGILSRVPGLELVDAAQPRSGVGKLKRRIDLAFLSTMFAFGALLNAFGMVSPVYALEQWVSDALGIADEGPVLALLFVGALIVEPLLLLGLAALWMKKSTRSGEALMPIAVRYAYSLVPLGFGVWLSHYCFHFLTGALTFIPVVQSLAQSTGIAFLGVPNWTLGGLSEEVVYPIELGFLGLGFVITLAVTWRIAERDDPDRPARAFVPWAVMHSAILVAAVWLLSQPMEMRGTFLG